MKDLFIGFKEGFTAFGHNISIIINSLLLSFVYLIGVGFTSLFGKLVKKQFLDKKQKKDSYWETLNLKKRKKEEYYRMF